LVKLALIVVNSSKFIKHQVNASGLIFNLQEGEVGRDDFFGDFVAFDYCGNVFRSNFHIDLIFTYGY